MINVMIFSKSAPQDLTRKIWMFRSTTESGVRMEEYSHGQHTHRHRLTEMP